MIPTNEPTLKLSTKEKMAYAVGKLPGAFYMSFYGQLQAFYYAWMGLGVGYILIAQILFGIWNVINDPLFGYLQDRTRTKQGRYIPWIKWFSPLFTISFILIFFVPQEWRFAYSGVDTQLWVFLWYLISLCLYDTGFTIVYLAYAAILPQVSHDFNERTQMSILSIVFAAIGEVVSGLFPLIFLTNPTAEKILGFQICVVVFGIAALFPLMFLVRHLRERYELIPEKSESFLNNIRYVFKNPACRIYMIYDAITVGINNNFMTAITFILAWTLGYENPYGLHTLTIPDLIPYLIIPAIGAGIGVWLQIWLPKKKDLKTLMLWDYLFMAVGFFIAFLGAIPSSTQSDVFFETPPNLWGVSIGFGIALLGFLGSIIYLDPLNADVVDYDEVLTGNRRESVYSGTNCIFSKPMSSIILIIFPAIIAAYGLVPVSNVDINSNALTVAFGFRQAIFGVAVASFLVPAIMAFVGFFCFLPYPLNAAKLREIHQILDEKHAKQRSESLNRAKNL